MRGSKRAKGRRNEPRPGKGEPETPPQLSEAAAEVWPQLLEQIKGVGTLAVTDGFPLARYCELFVRWWKAAAFLVENGETYVLREPDKDGPKGKVQGKVRCIMQFPQVSIVNNLSNELRRLEAEFGLTPAARTRIQVEPKEKPGAVRKRNRRA